ncbi:MAG: single-stranded-DNA-specific exonuclease RecJ [Bacteroidia bacterium]|nr:single-stranded-DNA-specific exonuclease RecJ [Bacteroidia bacterium]MCZ2248983.1 single-stranded-DNA-specific exonuclease RecJ [Bacteroidia bacterium]
MKKRWSLQEDVDRSVIGLLSLQLGVKPLLSRILYLRGIKNWDDAKNFFRPELSKLHDPFLMSGMDLAITRIEAAIKNNEKILVYGDYDVDGTTAVALVYSFFKTFYENLDFYIPDRYSEGYGISFQGIDYAHKNDFKLIIALDCGIKSTDKIDYANEKGIDFIICDHHLPGNRLPNAVAVLDPKIEHCKYPFKELSGCGIGYKLIQAYSKRNNLPESDLEQYLDLVAVSIASDIVPIVDENRILAYYGLQVLNNRKRKGFDAILTLAGFNKKLSITDIVFTIAPRINAAGRIASGRTAVELLISDTPEEALNSSEEINISNAERRTLDQNTTKQALSMLEELDDNANKKSTVLYNPEWHKGVVGIVASRLTDKYYRPTVILTSSNGMATGSARSVKDFDVYKALEACSDLLEQYGGHKYAAGLTLKTENVNAFMAKFEMVVSQTIETRLLTPEVEIDAEVRLEDLDAKFLRILKQLAPFGPGNMMPVFLVRGVKDKGFARLVGNNHLKLDIYQDDYKQSFPAIAFNAGDKYEKLLENSSFDICFTVEENEFNGNVSLQLNIKDIKFEYQKTYCPKAFLDKNS